MDNTNIIVSGEPHSSSRFGRDKRVILEGTEATTYHLQSFPMPDDKERGYNELTWRYPIELNFEIKGSRVDYEFIPEDFFKYFYQFEYQENFPEECRHFFHDEADWTDDYHPDHYKPDFYITVDNLMVYFWARKPDLENKTPEETDYCYKQAVCGGPEGDLFTNHHDGYWEYGAIEWDWQ